MEKKNPEVLTLLALYSKLTDVIVGNADEKNLTEIPLPQLVYTAQKEKCLMKKDVLLYEKYQKRVQLLMREIGDTMKRLTWGDETKI